MDRRGFLTAFMGAAAGYMLASSNASALTPAQPALPDAPLEPEHAVQSEAEREAMRPEEARLRRYRRHWPRRRRIITHRYRARRPYYVYRRPRHYYRRRWYGRRYW
jgi:hypothetical protein